MFYANLNSSVPTVCAEGVLQSLFNMHEVFQQLKKSNCFDWKRKDVTGKSGERLKKEKNPSGSNSSSCVVQLTSARFKMFVTASVTACEGEQGSVHLRPLSRLQ